MLDAKTVQTEALVFDAATVAVRGARDYQEDNVIAHFPLGQGSGFSVVADGMGGHENGALASGIVTSEVFSQFKMKEGLLDAGLLNVPAALLDAAEGANARMADYIGHDPETRGMGSTLLVTVIAGSKLYWVSVGDSPLLLFRGGALRRLNKDHSMAPQIDMMVKTGAMTADVGRDHPDRNTLTSAILGDQIDMIDCPQRPVALLPGDVVIAATDGLFSLPSRTIAKTLSLTQDGRSMDIAQALMAAITEQDSPDQDNASFVVVKLSQDETQGDALEAEDLPVLAMADEDDTPPPKPMQRPVSHDPDFAGGMDLSDVEQEDDREGKAYWYRGQKYYKE